MRRRRFLAALGGSASLGLGGLLSYRASQTRTLSVASVETYDAAFRLDDHRHRDVELTDRGSLDPEETRLVRSAVDGGYETEDPQRWVSRFRDDVEFVRLDGAFYRLSDTFPRLVVRAEPYDGDPSAVSVASTERFHEVINRHSDFRDDTFLPLARTDGVVDREPRRGLRRFFETYDAVEFGGRLFRFSATYRDPGSPYTVTAERVSEETVRDARSVALDDVEGPAHDRLREAVDAVQNEETESDLYGLVDPSPDLITELRTTRVLRADGNSYHVDAWALDHLSLSVTATPTEAGMGFKDPGRIAFAVENQGDRPVSMHGGSPYPFGGLRFRPTDGGRYRHLYAVSGRGSSMWPTTGSTYRRGDEELASGDRYRAEYAIGGDARGVPTGTYVVEGSLGVESRFRGGDFPFRVVIEIR